MTIDELITELLHRQDELTRIEIAEEVLPSYVGDHLNGREGRDKLDRCVERLKRAIEDARGVAEPAWNYSIDRYRPREGDYCLTRNDDGSYRSWPVDSVPRARLGVALKSAIAFWRPPAPPEVPDA